LVFFHGHVPIWKAIERLPLCQPLFGEPGGNCQSGGQQPDEGEGGRACLEAGEPHRRRPDVVSRCLVGKGPILAAFFCEGQVFVL